MPGARSANGNARRPEAVVGDRARGGHHAGARVEELAVRDRAADPLAPGIEPPRRATDVHDFGVRRAPLEQVARSGAEGHGEAVAGRAEPELPERGAREPFADPAVVVHHRGVDTDAGERRPASGAGEEIQAADAADVAAQEAREILGMPARRRAHCLRDGVPRPERQHSEARRARRAPLGALEDPVHPRDERAVAPAREHRPVPAGDHLLGDFDRVVLAPRHEEVLAWDDAREGAPDLRVHLLRVGIEQDRYLGAWPDDRLLARAEEALGARDHSKHAYPDEDVTRMSRFVSKCSATARQGSES